MSPVSCFIVMADRCILQHALPGLPPSFNIYLGYNICQVDYLPNRQNF